MNRQVSLLSLFVATTIVGLLLTAYYEVTQPATILNVTQLKWPTRFCQVRAVDLLIVGLLIWIAVRQHRSSKIAETPNEAVGR